MKKNQPNPYDVLGVDKQASENQIKKAFRKKVAKAHPDAGGDPEEFNAIALAYHVLGHTERRAMFDAEGEYRQNASADKQACDMIAAMMQEILSKGEHALYTDMIGEMKERMHNTIRNAEGDYDKKQRQCRKNIENLKGIRERVTMRPGGLPIVIAFLDQGIRSEEQEATVARLQWEDCKKSCERACEILGDYTFTVKHRDPGRRESYWGDADFMVTPKRDTMGYGRMMDDMLKRAQKQEQRHG